MVVSDLLQQARARFGSSPSAVLRADQPTGEKPWEMLVTDEHTENYLSLRANGESDIGLITGILGEAVFFMFALLIPWMAVVDKWDAFNYLLLVGLPAILIPFFWETRRPLPLPILFNRRTQEVYFDHNGELYHTPWDGAEAVAGEFMLVGPHTGGMRNASLELLVRRLGEPDNALLVSLGLPMGKTLQMQKGFWEWLRAYMDNGPWFDENGQRSDSDAYVKEMLKASAIKPTDWHKFTLDEIRKSKAENGGSNYLSASDFFILCYEILFYPMHWLQVFTYKVAKRRSRNRWPQIVMERLQDGGPTTRLIDLERERGLDV
ncbi:hypothetical protein WG219_21370 [Ectopseudomonas mendocina]|uniref:Uncharacterized protein n=1 Tax=Ectopseudomonas mendocina TaxID=300 RepID=A0ABZ2RKU5_ECTME